MRKKAAAPLIATILAVIAWMWLTDRPRPLSSGSNQILDGQIRAAKLANQTTLRLPATIGLPLEVPSFSEVLKSYSLIRAVVSDSKSFRTDYSLRTIYKLSVLETLCRKATGESDPALDKIPKELLPLADSELLLFTDGGHLWMDGILVTQPPSVDGFSLQIGQMYLIAIHLGGKWSAGSAGGAATILLVDHGQLKPLPAKNKVFFDDIERQFQNSLDRLVLSLRSQQGSSQMPL